MLSAGLNQFDMALNSIEVSRDCGEIEARLHSITRVLKVDHIIFSWLEKPGLPTFCATVSKAWQNTYRAEGFQAVDPVLIRCLAGITLVNWADLDWSKRKVAAFRRAAWSHGLGSQGCSLPVRGPRGQFAVLSLSRNCDEEFWRRQVEKVGRQMILLGTTINRRILELDGPAEVDSPVQPLSRRETQALGLLAGGNSRARAAQTLQISEHTLRVYIEGARSKLAAENTTHAVAKAIAIGLISV